MRNRASLIGFGELVFCPLIIKVCCYAARGDPVLYLNNPPGVTRADRRAQLDALVAINQ